MTTKASSPRKGTHTHAWKNAKLPFPFILHQMLKELSEEGVDESIVSWQPHGRAFRVHDRNEFKEKIMPRYFRQTHYKSFQRQLHLYGFHRILSGLDKGAYYHKLFLRDEVHLCFQMTRCKVKGKTGTSSQQKATDPDFYVDFQNANIRNVGTHLIQPCSSDPRSSGSLQHTLINCLIDDEAFFEGRRFFIVETEP